MAVSVAFEGIVRGGRRDWYAYGTITSDRTTRVLRHAEVRFTREPTVPEAIAALNTLGISWEDVCQRRDNPLNDIVNRMEIPLRDHTRDIWIFIAQQCFANPAITQTQILSALTGRFVGSPYGNFSAFITTLRNYWGFASWAALRDYIVARQAFFDQGILQGRQGMNPGG